MTGIGRDSMMRTSSNVTAATAREDTARFRAFVDAQRRRLGVIEAQLVWLTPPRQRRRLGVRVVIGTNPRVEAVVAFPTDAETNAAKAIRPRKIAAERQYTTMGRGGTELRTARAEQLDPIFQSAFITLMARDLGTGESNSVTAAARARTVVGPNWFMYWTPRFVGTRSDGTSEADHFTF